MVNVAFSPNDIAGDEVLPRIPSSQPACVNDQSSVETRKLHELLPRMTLPMPIVVSNSPRPTELSNLHITVS
jgi:hypothetical protein